MVIRGMIFYIQKINYKIKLNYKKIKNCLKIKNLLYRHKNKKVILYAPTWRDDEYYSKGNYSFELNLNLDQMQKELGDEYVIILRMHYLIASELDISDYEGFVYDYSLYSDIGELYLVSDL